MMGEGSEKGAAVLRRVGLLLATMVVVLVVVSGVALTKAIVGSNSGDELLGGPSADYLNADDPKGGDTLNGGDGNDHCDGDQAQDTFISCEHIE